MGVLRTADPCTASGGLGHKPFSLSIRPVLISDRLKGDEFPGENAIPIPYPEREKRNCLK
jgi:hypothetical protein